MILSKRSFALRIIIVVLMTVTSCNVEVAKESENQFVTIYTDCLEQKDLLLFKNFQEENHISVRIVYLSANDIISKIKNEGILVFWIVWIGENLCFEISKKKN